VFYLRPPAATVGIKENDVVLEVDEKKIENMDHFYYF